MFLHTLGYFKGAQCDLTKTELVLMVFPFVFWYLCGHTLLPHPQPWVSHNPVSSDFTLPYSTKWSRNIVCFAQIPFNSGTLKTILGLCKKSMWSQSVWCPWCDSRTYLLFQLWRSLWRETEFQDLKRSDWLDILGAPYINKMTVLYIIACNLLYFLFHYDKIAC